MKLYIVLLYITFSLVCSTAFASVGTVSESNSVSADKTGQSYGYQIQTISGSSGTSSTGYDYSLGYDSSGSTYSAPQIDGPQEEQMTAEDLGLSIPDMESFVPDDSLGFVSASPTVSTKTAAQTTSTQSGSSTTQYSSQTQTKSYSLYFPSQVSSSNRFYIETGSGLKTSAGCSLHGYMPLWSDIRSTGNLFVYEWYPGYSSPSVSWWGWTETGWKKGWFYGDEPGWHTLCYNSGFWSNYIYIYVYPNTWHSGTASYSEESSSEYYSSSTVSTLPDGAPVPPDPSSENIVMPDYSRYRPVTSQTTGSSSATASSVSTGSLSPASANPALLGASGTTGTSMFATTSTTYASSTTTAGGDYGVSAYASNCPYCSQTQSSSEPYGYVSGSLHAVYPLPSVCKCNEYYVQVCTGELETVAGVFCGEWLALWSKLSRGGEYWSYEWTAYGSDSYSYCTPEANSFGYKKSGWQQTWFKGNEPGWHILSYYCNDWSNYIYIYVWPED